MSGAIKYQLIEDIGEIAGVDTESIDKNDQIHFTKLSEMCTNMDQLETIACVSALFSKYPHLTYKTMAFYVEKKGVKNEQVTAN